MSGLKYIYELNEEEARIAIGTVVRSLHEEVIGYNLLSICEVLERLQKDENISIKTSRAINQIDMYLTRLMEKK